MRGQRIELGEIEATLAAASGVGQVVVLFVPRSARVSGWSPTSCPLRVRSWTSAAVREYAGEQLPGYMVPAAWMVLAALPLNPSGKLDRKALPAPQVETRQFRAPATPVEQIIADVFADVLGIGASEATGGVVGASEATGDVRRGERSDGSVPSGRAKRRESVTARVGLDDDFFELGGNSLIATQVVARLGAALGTRVPVRMLFEAPTVAGLAARAESHTGERRVALVARERPARIPLSLPQQRMWFLNRFAPESTAENIVVAVRLSGLLNRPALQQAIIDVLERHESLRTRYPEDDGEPHQVVVPAAEGGTRSDPGRGDRGSVGR